MGKKKFTRHMQNLRSAKNFGDLLKHHGQAETSLAAEVINRIDQGLARPDIRNQTEARVIQFSQEINDFLYPQNDFIMKSINDPQFAASGQTRRINEGVQGKAVVKGRFHPLTLANGDNAPEVTPTVRRNNNRDVQIEYFRVTPEVEQMERSMEVPYDSRNELLRSHAEVLMVAKGNHTAVEWAPGAVGTGVVVDNQGNDNYIFTTGTERNNPVANTTNNVRGIAYEDIVKVKTAFSRQRVMMGGMSMCYFLPTPEQLEDIWNLDQFTKYDETGIPGMRESGMIGRILGFEVLDPRYRDDWNANILYNSAAGSGNRTLTKIADNASAATGHVSAGLFWKEDYVYTARGATIVFPWMNSPTYFGDVYASEARFTAWKKRQDQKGVVALVETPV